VNYQINKWQIVLGDDHFFTVVDHINQLGQIGLCI